MHQAFIFVASLYVVSAQFDLLAIDGPHFGFFDQESVVIPDEPAIEGQQVCAFLEKQDLPQFSLSQSDFEQGTKIIDASGVYTLSGNIVFDPNSADALGVDFYSAGDVQPQQFSPAGPYDPRAYGIGFFAAIAIATDDVIIDLNGFTIEQSVEHALNMRFYTHIELATSPFIQGQGPHDFGSMRAAKNLCIKNGVLGLSSHGGIHGNGNQNIEIRDLTIKDYETAGIQINKGIDVLIENIELPNAREDVPVACRFSPARFIRPWINKLVSSGYTGTLQVGTEILTVTDIQQKLRDIINDVSQQVVSTGKITGEYEKLFGNPSGLPDGSAAYGVLINFNGVAVNGMPANVPIDARSQRINIKNVNIGQIKLFVKEVPVLTVDGKTASTDVVGAAFHTEDGFTLNKQFEYAGNPLANAQLIVAKAINEGFDFGFLSTGKNKIKPEIVAWAESGESYFAKNLTYICNGDVMFHVDKGPIAYKLDATTDLTCTNCAVGLVENKGGLGSKLCNNNREYLEGTGVSNPFATQFGYGGGASRGFSLSSSTNVELTDCKVDKVVAKAGDAIGLDISFGSSVVKLVNFVVGELQAGAGYKEEDYVNNPTPLPKSQSVHQDESIRGVEIL
eukprot:TRINITY_DN11370_c0_g1_i2.p1 TRINITY_DN11370_c0_g1~~TRINITY_DN11370_c0_g1_i2.p1  ORF type:complete len:674 (+),score=120.30 TRINITY_DN11370_c0_g1_i2:165-2024(+)